MTSKVYNCLYFRFYIILSGSVSIYLDSKLDEKEKQSDNNTGFHFSHHLPPLPEQKNAVVEQEDEDQGLRAAAIRGDHGTRRRMSIVWKPRRVVEDDAERKKLGVVVNTLGNTLL